MLSIGCFLGIEAERKKGTLSKSLGFNCEANITQIFLTGWSSICYAFMYACVHLLGVNCLEPTIHKALGRLCWTGQTWFLPSAMTLLTVTKWRKNCASHLTPSVRLCHREDFIPASQYLPRRKQWQLSSCVHPEFQSCSLTQLSLTTALWPTSEAHNKVSICMEQSV